MMRRAFPARRAEEFAAAIDGRASAATLSDETAAFLALVAQLRDVDTPQLRPEFAADLRMRLMAEAPVALADLPPLRVAPPTLRGSAPAPTPRRRAVQVLATACVIFGTAGGVAAASQSALPGDPLYSVKRGIENVQVAIAGSSADRGDVLLDHAETRLTEVQALAVAKPDDVATAELMSEALAAFNDQANDGADALVDAYESDADGADIVRVRDFADDSVDRLLQLSNVVPAPVRDDLADAAAVLVDIDGTARTLCPSCSALGPVELSSSMRSLQEATQGIIDLLPSIDPTPGSSTQSSGGQVPPNGLPTVPDQTAPGGGQPTDGGSDPGGGGSTQQPGPGTPTLPGGGGLPSLPLPSLPLPSLPLPSLPLPSLPLPSLPLPLPTILGDLPL